MPFVSWVSGQEFSFNAKDESRDSVNRGNFIELVNHVAQYDVRLANHFENSSAF